MSPLAAATLLPDAGKRSEGVARKPDSATVAARRARRVAAGVQAGWLHGLASGPRVQVASQRG